MKLHGKHTTAEVMLPREEIEDSLLEEMQEQVDHEAFQNPIKYMPDTHGGLGPHAIVGFSMKLGDRIIPNSVGGDIGCGMTAVKLDGVDADFDNIDDLREINDDVRNAVPMGTGRVNRRPPEDFEWLYPWNHANSTLMMLFDYLRHGNVNEREFNAHKFDMDYFHDLCERVGISEQYATNSLGSLGGGNHFIEIAESETDGSIWVVVHSGSRNLGQKVCSYHQDRAIKLRSNEIAWDDMTPEEREYAKSDGTPNWEKIKRAFDGEKIETFGKSILEYSPDEQRNTKLDYLEGAEMFSYLKDMVFTQEYATENRRQMALEVAAILGTEITDVINSPHNYVDFEDGVIRKGSTRALSGEEFVVPMNMEDGTLVCCGKGNRDWNQSAPHGAGRLGSRGWAHQEFDADTARQRMYENGTYSSNVPGDEVPEAYKDAALIERSMQPTARVTDHLIPRMNFKA